VNWRRNKCLTLLTQGCSTYEIAEILKISQSTAARDVQWLHKQAEEESKLHIKSLPHEYRMVHRGMSEVLRTVPAGTVPAVHT
jgi:transposase